MSTEDAQRGVEVEAIALAGLGGGGTHEPTNEFEMTEVGKGGRFYVVVVCGGTVFLLSTGAAQGGSWGAYADRARV